MKLMDFSDDCRELSLVSLNKEIGYRMSMKMRKANVSDFQQQPTHPFDEGGGIGFRAEIDRNYITRSTIDDCTLWKCRIRRFCKLSTSCR